MGAKKGNKNALGHTYSRESKFDIGDIIKQLKIYTDNEEQPLLQEFALNYGISREWLNQLKEQSEELAEAIKRLFDKQEIFLIKKGTNSPAKDIFRLKQPCFGYTDKSELQQDTTINVVFDGIPRPQLKDKNN